ncbi:MAG: dTMP kinase [Treponema sp.]|jgi:dTMP kinase|nr:dTMP kinase [Treponema sp.]
MILPNFVVIEGCDGSGTTTALEGLKRRHGAEPGLAGTVPLFATREPSPGPVGLFIRRVLRGELSVEKETLARLFAADRGEHLHAPGGLLERCRRGELAVSDRYIPSSLVYQGLECGRELPEALNAPFPQPELLIYLDIDPQTAMDRIERRSPGEREIYEKADFLAKVRGAYRELLPQLERDGVRVLSLDGTRPPEEVGEAIWRAVREMPIMRGK